MSHFALNVHVGEKTARSTSIPQVLLLLVKGCFRKEKDR